MNTFLSRTAMRWAVPFKILEERAEQATDGHTCVPMRFFFILLLNIGCRRNDRVAFRCTSSAAEWWSDCQLFAIAGSGSPGRGRAHLVMIVANKWWG